MFQDPGDEQDRPLADLIYVPSPAHLGEQQPVLEIERGGDVQRLGRQHRIATFFNGAVARERLIDLNDEDRRLVWSIVDGPYTHHNGIAQVFANGDGTTRFLWIADLLPNELAEVTSDLMERGIDTVKSTLEAHSRR